MALRQRAVKVDCCKNTALDKCGACGGIEVLKTFVEYNTPYYTSYIFQRLSFSRSILLLSLYFLILSMFGDVMHLPNWSLITHTFMSTPGKYVPPHLRRKAAEADVGRESPISPNSQSSQPKTLTDYNQRPLSIDELLKLWVWTEPVWCEKKGQLQTSFPFSKPRPCSQRCAEWFNIHKMTHCPHHVYYLHVSNWN